MPKVKLDGEARLSLPPDIVRRLQLGPEDELEVEIRNGEIVMRKAAASSTEALQSLAGEDWRGIADELLRSRKEWDERNS